MKPISLPLLALVFGLSLPCLAQEKPPEGGAPAAPAAETITIARKALAADDCMVVERRFNAEMTMTFGGGQGQQGQTLNQKMKRSEDRFVRVLEVKEGLATKVLVSYDRELDERSMNGMGGMPPQNEEIKGPRHGNIYIVEAAAAGPKARLASSSGEGSGDDSNEGNDEEGPFPMGEKAIKGTETASAGLFAKSGYGLASSLPDRPLKVGESIELSKPFVLELLDMQNDDFKVRFAAMTLKGKAKLGELECAEFEVKIEVGAESQEMGGMEMKVELKGKTWIALESGRSQGHELEGDLEINSQGQEGIDGDGKITIKETVKYRTATKDDKVEPAATPAAPKTPETPATPAPETKPEEEKKSDEKKSD